MPSSRMTDAQHHLCARGGGRPPPSRSRSVGPARGPPRERLGPIARKAGVLTVPEGRVGAEREQRSAARPGCGRAPRRPPRRSRRRRARGSRTQVLTCRAAGSGPPARAYRGRPPSATGRTGSGEVRERGDARAGRARRGDGLGAPAAGSRRGVRSGRRRARARLDLLLLQLLLDRAVHPHARPTRAAGASACPSICPETERGRPLCTSTSSISSSTPTVRTVTLLPRPPVDGCRRAGPESTVAATRRCSRPMRGPGCRAARE